MKKLTTVLLTFTMVLGVAAIASAGCFNCYPGGVAPNIDRGCDGLQVDCYPWDFENMSDYCSPGKGHNRAIFKICDCIPEVFETIEADDTVDVSMEILVDSGNGPTGGDNGVYWAENVNSTSVNLGLYADQDDACKDDRYPETFGDGSYTYYRGDLKTTGKPATWVPAEGATSCDKLTDEQRVVKFAPTKGQSQGSHGYLITSDNEDFGEAAWAIDIPELRLDPDKVVGGEKVWVKICLTVDCAGICNEDLECCCEIFIGELCCDGADVYTSPNTLVYPYFPPANTTAWNLVGMTISNLDKKAGKAVITMYEADGDVGSVTVDVAAKGTYLNTLNGPAGLAAIMEKTAGAGTLGDSKNYMVVTPDFNATGFVMIADTLDGASMGYLPIPEWFTKNPLQIISKY